MTPLPPAKAALLQAILPHVAFDGWSETAFRAAARDAEMPLREARDICPRGALDLAAAFHREGDREMARRLRSEGVEDMRIRDRIARAIRVRLDATGDKEAVRRGTSLFALPIHAAEGARLIWGTADAIWTAVGDPSDDINWYTKRATLSGVYGATVLYWLGDDSVGHQATDDFIDRRIGEVMQIETIKGRIRSNPLLKPFLAPLEQIGARIRPPMTKPPVDLPGRWTPAAGDS